jgi:hypothetical protein
MHEDGIKLFNLMFRPGESVCVSHNKYGYHSVPLENVTQGTVTLVSPNEDQEHEHVPSRDLLLVALNPIKGFRNDLSVTAYRNFLVEIDHGTIESQLEYANTIGVPYSAVVFSGNKSLHFLISLSEDLPSENVWRKLAEWTLGIANLADPNTKNPSRSIRIPGAMREPEKYQSLLSIKDPIAPSEFVAWLNKHPGCKPKERVYRPRSETPDIEKVSGWVKFALEKGLDPLKGRNRQWFAIACDFALSGFSKDDTLDLLAGYFAPDRDFTEREWRTTVESAFKYMDDRGR